MHSSGHLYFTLKDAGSQVRCVMFRNAAQNLMILPQDGMQVVVRGNVTVYERAGQYQLNVQQLQVAGQGELALAFERLKKKLAEQGLFDPEHKRPLPKYPKAIGLVTSPTGAAVRDIIRIARRRCPSLELVLRPVQVQGIGASEQIAAAIADFNEYGKVDLMIVGRGGGSAEDLWAFNEEVLARAIYDSKIPVVSAVGHEVDFTIADFVADLRASTPSAAAEIAVPDSREIFSQLDDAGARMANALLSLFQSYRERLAALKKSYGLNRLADMLRQKWQQLDWAGERLDQCMEQSALNAKHRLGRVQAALQALDPKNVLERGYSICRDARGRAVRQSASLKPSDELAAEFWRGRATVTVKEVKP